jgi:3-oxoadipate enol-lactonase
MRKSYRGVGVLTFGLAFLAAGAIAADGRPPRTGNAQLPGATVFYRDAGQGRPALFVSALLIDSRLWLAQLDGLSDQRRCLAFDFSGFGFSSPLHGDKIDSRRYADELLQFLDAMKIQEPVDVVALSAGGLIASLAYEKAPHRFRSMVLISTTFGPGMDAAAVRYRAENARTVVIEGRDALFRRFNEYIVSPEASLIARARYKTMLEQTPYESLVAFLTTNEQLASEQLPTRMRLPVMIPVGQNDSVVTVSDAQKLAARFPDARTIVIPGAGRLLPLEAPALLNDSIRDFWHSLDEQAGNR